MISREKAMGVLVVYMVLAPLVAVYLLFFSGLDFLFQIIGVVLIGGGLIMLALFNLLLMK